MKLLPLVGVQKVGCCDDEELGYFDPTLGRMYTPPITPGVKYTKTPNGLMVVEHETAKEEFAWH
jgi:hypothetical protein